MTSNMISAFILSKASVIRNYPTEDRYNYKNWYVVSVHEDGEGNVEIMHLAYFDPEESIFQMAEINKDSGSWEVALDNERRIVTNSNVGGYATKLYKHRLHFSDSSDENESSEESD